MMSVILALGLLLAVVETGHPPSDPLGGTLQYEGGELHFSEILSLIFILEEGAESIPQNVSEWPLDYDPQSPARSVPLRWVRSIRILEGEHRPGYRCLFSPMVEIETVNGVLIRSRYRTLEWLKVRTRSGQIERIFFSGDRRILRIDFSR